MATVTTFITVIMDTMSILLTSQELILLLNNGFYPVPFCTFSFSVFPISHTHAPRKKSGNDLMQNACTSFVISLGAVTVNYSNIFSYA